MKLNPNMPLCVHIEPQAGDATEIYGQQNKKTKKKHSKKLTRGLCFLLNLLGVGKKSSGSAVRPRWHSLKIINVFFFSLFYKIALVDSQSRQSFVIVFVFFLIKGNLKMMFVFSVSFKR